MRIGRIHRFVLGHGLVLTFAVQSPQEADSQAEPSLSFRLAAQQLGIHVNTVRQRLGSIEDLVGHWGKATRALELHFASRLWHLGGSAHGRGSPEPQ